MEILRQHLVERVPLAELSVRVGVPSRELEQWRRQLLEQGDRVFRDDSIPIGLKFEFEQFAASACEEAKMDGKDRALAARNLVNQLEQDWLSNIEAGHGTGEATRLVYERFGQLHQVVACLRQPPWLRLILYQDYRPHRMLIVMAFAFLLGVSRYATEFHQSQFYQLSVPQSPLGFFQQFVDLLLPVIAFLVPSVARSVETGGTPTKRFPEWMPHLKGLLGATTLILLGWQLVIAFVRVPFFVIAVDAWSVSLLQLLYFWLLGLAAIPALGCLAAEAFIRPGEAGENTRRRLLRFLRRCDAGRWMIGG
jgi:hypothetical protein